MLKKNRNRNIALQTFLNKFFDALASGTPILINGGGWQADLINAEDAGITTFGLTLHQAALKINEFLDDKKRLRRSSKNAQIIAEKYFDKGDLVQRIEETLLLSINNKDINLSTVDFKSLVKIRQWNF